MRSRDVRGPRPSRQASAPGGAFCLTGEVAPRGASAANESAVRAVARPSRSIPRAPRRCTYARSAAERHIWPCGKSTCFLPDWRGGTSGRLCRQRVRSSSRREAFAEHSASAPKVHLCPICRRTAHMAMRKIYVAQAARAACARSVPSAAVRRNKGILQLEPHPASLDRSSATALRNGHPATDLDTMGASFRCGRLRRTPPPGLMVKLREGAAPFPGTVRAQGPASRWRSVRSGLLAACADTPRCTCADAPSPTPAARTCVRTHCSVAARPCRASRPSTDARRSNPPSATSSFAPFTSQVDLATAANWISVTPPPKADPTGVARRRIVPSVL